MKHITSIVCARVVLIIVFSFVVLSTLLFKMTTDYPPPILPEEDGIPFRHCCQLIFTYHPRECTRRTCTGVQDCMRQRGCTLTLTSWIGITSVISDLKLKPHYNMGHVLEHHALIHLLKYIRLCLKCEHIGN